MDNVDPQNNNTLSNADEVTQLQEKIVELENNWKRALADYKNLEKRVFDERLELVKYSNEVLIQRLLFILDNLELVIKHDHSQGLELVLKEFKQILTDEGLEEIPVVDMVFDESTMDAIDTIEVYDEEKGNMVLEVLQKGYLLKNKVIRPAKVKVGKIKGGN